MKPLHLAAIFATFLLVATGVNMLLRPPHNANRLLKLPKPKPVAEAPCKIKRAVFGGTESALLKVRKGRFVHYVVLDLPTDDPRMPKYQSDWLRANYGEAQPSVIGVYLTVEDAVRKAASLCRRN